MKKICTNLLFAVLCAFSYQDCTAAAGDALKPFIIPQAIQTPHDVISFFPKTVEEMEENIELAKRHAFEKIGHLISIPPEERTFENTILEFDKVTNMFSMQISLVGVTQFVHPNQEMRDKAETLIEESINFSIDFFNANSEITRAFAEYFTNSWNIDQLNEERSYYLLNLLNDVPTELSEANDQKNLINKETESLIMQFNTNIAQANAKLVVSREELSGLDESFIQSLERDGENYILKCNYPTWDQVMTGCDIEKTRQQYKATFDSRTYPDNLTLLEQIINQRDELAKLSGYRSFADMDIQSTMAETPERVEEFLDAVEKRVIEVAEREIEILMQDLPKSVTLTADGRLKSWDLAYLTSYYKRKYLNVDDQVISEYFPLDQTIQGTLSVFGQFLNLSFEVIPCQDLWDPAVKLIKVKKNDQEQSLVGYLLLDLFPRDNKYSHCCCQSLIPPLSFDEGKTFQPSLVLIVANFTEPRESIPALLKHSEVETFFHEFGHSLHALLGQAEMPTKAAYNTKMDFIETPSQLLEEWVWDKDILKLISSHYLTGEPLSDDLIQLMLTAKQFGQARWLLGQSIYSRISLDFYKEGKDKDLEALEDKLTERILKYVAPSPDSHFICTFSHLTGYGAKYYNYLWAKELSLQIFAYIKSHGGPLDPIMGQRYIDKIIGKGGSVDPNIIMVDFLAEDSYDADQAVGQE